MWKTKSKCEQTQLLGYVLLYVLDDKSLITANDPIKGSFGSWDWKNMGKKKM